MKLATILKITAAIVLMLAALPAIAFAETITVTGTVTDAKGDPVSGANVTLLDDSHNTLGVVKTDADGNFIFMKVSTYGSSLVKPLVTYINNGHNYSTRLENIQWCDASQGLLKLPEAETRLYDYPPSDHGYAWGTVMDSTTNGKALEATVYLSNTSVTLSTETRRQGMIGSFLMEVSPGTYEIIAVHKAGNYSQVSNRTTITIVPAYDYMQSAPINLIADRWLSAENLTGIPTVTATLTPPVVSPNPTPFTTPTSLPSPSPVPGAEPVKVVPLAAALVIGAVMVIAGWALLKRK